MLCVFTSLVLMVNNDNLILKVYTVFWGTTCSVFDGVTCASKIIFDKKQYRMKTLITRIWFR